MHPHIEKEFYIGFTFIGFQLDNESPVKLKGILENKSIEKRMHIDNRIDCIIYWQKYCVVANCPAFMFPIFTQPYLIYLMTAILRLKKTTISIRKKKRTINKTREVAAINDRLFAIKIIQLIEIINKLKILLCKKILLLKIIRKKNASLKFRII